LAANKYGGWNETGATVPFTLAPFLWQTAWFKCLVIVLPLLGGYGYFRRRLAWDRRHAELERRAAVSSERAEIARDLHDHLGARLTLVQHLTETLGRASSPDATAESAQGRLMELARELNASLDGAVWAVQPDKDTLASLADYLGDSFQELLVGTNIELELEFPESLPAWPLSRAERYHLALIAIEALNNALKHSSACLVRLRLEVTGEGLELIVADNGRGFVSEQLNAETQEAKPSSGGHGLANMRHRTDLLGGHIEFANQRGGGAMVTVSLVPSALRRADKSFGNNSPERS
jgi:signal transduction histidine kinase